MDSTQMVEKLKGMGLCRIDRSKVMETYRDAGEVEALEQANGYLERDRIGLANAKAAAEALCGIKI